MALLDVLGLKKQYGEDNLIFDDVSFQIRSGQKVGLIGANGAGKSTLFKVLIGEEKQDSGTIQYQKDAKIGYLEQHTCRQPNRTAYEEVLTVFEHLISLEKKLEDIQADLSAGTGDLDHLIKSQFHLQEEYERKGGFVFRSKVRSTLLGMGFSEEELSKKVGIMSGGQKTRVALAKLLLSDANLLFLDEPTNHLDLVSCKWLEDYLQSYNGAVLIISHDRYLLDRVTDTTIEVEHQRAEIYPGGYSRAMKIKEERAFSLAKKNENLSKEIKRMEESAAQLHQWNREKSVKRARNVEKAVERLRTQLVDEKQALRSISLELDVGDVSGNEVLRLEQLSKTYSDKTLFKDFDLLIKRAERVFLLGPNGCGKTTLFRIITGEELPDEGSLTLGSKVSVGYYRQSLLFDNPNKTIFDEVHDEFPNLTHTEVRNHLSRFLFYGDDVFKRVETLSGGEKARVHLLKLMLKHPNFLLLDEPTNHLDIASKEIIESALMSFEGTLFVVSHDRYFINKLAERILYMENGSVQSFCGGYDYFLEHYVPEEKTEKTATDTESASQRSYKEQKENKNAYRKCISDIAKTEEKISIFEKEIESLEAEMQLPEIATDYVHLTELTELLQKKNEELEKLYDTWDGLQKMLETF